MEKSATVKARDLPSTARNWLGSVLHVDLSDGDECTVTVRRPPTVPELEQREAARGRLLGLMKRVGERNAAVPDSEIDDAIEEAMEFVRRRPIDAAHA